MARSDQKSKIITWIHKGNKKKTNIEKADLKIINFGQYIKYMYRVTPEPIKSGYCLRYVVY